MNTIAATSRGASLPPALRDEYGSDLEIPLVADRPTIAANFVTTLDGVVAFDRQNTTGGGPVSGFNEHDRFVMGLLRALSDAVLVGAATVRADPGGRWTPAGVYPAATEDYARLRSELGLAAQPVLCVVTASGQIDLTRPGFSDPAVPVLILTTPQGGARLAASATLSSNVEIEATGVDQLDSAGIVESLTRHGYRLVLCEGGPHLLGELLADGLIDELFLTVAPQLAGRSQSSDRLSLLEGRAFGADEAPWAKLIDSRAHGNHLFTRYRFGGI